MDKRIAKGHSPAPHGVSRAIDEAEIVRDFLPPPEELRKATKLPVTIRMDAKVVAWFKGLGTGYQTRINRVLRAYIKAKGG
jgi:uncharacterized protein (DUF4415 family)